MAATFGIDGQEGTGDPSWPSFPFFRCVQVPSQPSSTGQPRTFAGYPPSHVFAIEKLGLWPKGVNREARSEGGTNGQAQNTDIESYAEGSTSTSRSTRDTPYLLIAKTGRLTLVDPTTLAPLVEAYSTLPSGTVSHIHLDHASSRLVVLSEDEGGMGFPLMRIWDLRANAAYSSRHQNATTSQSPDVWAPRLLAETRIQHGRKALPVAALAATSSLGYLACSLSNGAVLLLRNLAATLDPGQRSNAPASNGPLVTMPKFKVVHQPENTKVASASSTAADVYEPVTALGFSFAADQSSDGSRSLHLFIATLSKVLRYTVLGKGAGNTPVTLDDVGAPLGCAAILPPKDTRRMSHGSSGEAKLLIARTEAIYVIGSNGREVCYAFEEVKSKITLLPSSRQLVVTSPLGSIEGEEAIKERAIRLGNKDEMTKVAVFDLEGRYISYRGELNGAVQAVFSDSATSKVTSKSGNDLPTIGREDVVILTHDGSLMSLREQPLEDRLGILFHRKMFTLAAQIARAHFATSSRLDDADSASRLSALLAQIYLKYGDHLYEQGDFEGSMKQGYIKSITAAAPTARNADGGGRRKDTLRYMMNHNASGLRESYVIRRFLDAQRIPLLTLYLQELHRRGLANSDHTTLLLNCFTKIKDTEALDRFIRRSHIVKADHPEDFSSIGPGDDDSVQVEDEDEEDGLDGNDGDKQRRLPYDLPVAIKVCRSAGYYEQAAYLAKRYDLGEDYLRIKIEDTRSPLEALEWIRTREASEVETYLKLYAALLLAGSGPADQPQARQQTTDLLIELCAGAYRPNIVNSAGALEQAAKAAKEHQEGSGARGVLRYLAGATSDSAAKQTDEAPYSVNGASTAGTPADPPATQDTQADLYSIPAPLTFFPHFLPYPDSFRRFLETVALARWGQVVRDDSRDAEQQQQSQAIEPLADGGEAIDEEAVDPEVREQQSVWNALLELYLRDQQKDAASPATKQSSSLALRVLQQHSELPYDATHALVLCHQANFEDGTVLLLERLGMYEEVVKYWIDRATQELESEALESSSRASEHVLEALARYNHVGAPLYSLVLSFLTSHPVLLSRHRRELEEILTRVEEEQLLSTLEIIELLSRASSHTNVVLIKSFLQRSVQEERSEMEADRRLVESYRSEAETKTKELEALSTGSEPRVFQSNRCNACGGQLDLPAVHFMVSLCAREIRTVVARALTASLTLGSNSVNTPTIHAAWARPRTSVPRVHAPLAWCERSVATMLTLRRGTICE